MVYLDYNKFKSTSPLLIWKNLEKIQPLDSVLHQKEVFFDLAHKIKKIDRYQLSKKDRIAFELMRYQINLNVERIFLEEKWLEQKPATIPENGVYDFHYNLKTNDSLVTDTNIYFSHVIYLHPSISPSQ